MTREEMKKRFHKDIVKHILLILFTFGIYEIIWIAKVTEFLNLKAPTDKQKSVVGTVLLCLFVPFYLIYWMYKVDEALIPIDPRPHNENLRVILLITSIVFSWVNVIYIQNVINIDVDQDNAFNGFASISTPKIEIDPNASNESLLKRAQMFIEDKEWHKASAYCEALLDREPENADVYLMLLLVKAQASTVDELKNGEVAFANFKEFEKVNKFCDIKFVDELIKANDEIIKRNSSNEIEKKYNKAVEFSNTSKISNLKKANKLLEDIKDYKNASELIESNNNKIKKNTLITIISIIAIVIVIILGSVIKNASQKAKAHREAYQAAVQLLEEDKYSQAIDAFEALGTYKDSEKQIENIKEQVYNDANAMYESNKFAEAKIYYKLILDYKDSAKRANELEVTENVINSNHKYFTQEVLDNYTIVEASKVPQLLTENEWFEIDDFYEESIVKHINFNKDGTGEYSFVSNGNNQKVKCAWKVSNDYLYFDEFHEKDDMLFCYDLYEINDDIYYMVFHDLDDGNWSTNHFLIRANSSVATAYDL